MFLLESHLARWWVFVITSPGSRGIRHAPGASRCRGLEVAKAARGHVASSGVFWKDVGGLRNVLCPSAAVPRPPVGFPAGLGGQMLGDVFGRVRGGGARGWSSVKVERCNVKDSLGNVNIEQWEEMLAEGRSARWDIKNEHKLNPQRLVGRQPLTCLKNHQFLSFISLYKCCQHKLCIPQLKARSVAALPSSCLSFNTFFSVVLPVYVYVSPQYGCLDRSLA